MMRNCDPELNEPRNGGRGFYLVLRIRFVTLRKIVSRKYGWFLGIMIRERWIICLLGLLAWTALAMYLPVVFGEPTLALVQTVRSPLAVGYILLSLNLIATLLRRHEQIARTLSDEQAKKDYESEIGRIRLVQEYGANVLLAASVIAAITAVRSAPGAPLFLAYLGSSIVVAIVALVPIWMPRHDQGPLLMLRHVKTVMLTFGVAWLAQAVAILLGFNPA